MLINNISITKWLGTLTLLMFVLFCGVETINAQEGSQVDPRRQLAPEDTMSASPNKIAIPYYSPKLPVDCEVANFYIDDVVRRWQASSNGSYLIVIARLGNGEKFHQLILTRLKTVKDYFKRYPDTKFITAEGERIDGYGCLEFYVNGKRLYVIPITKNADIDLFSCNGV